MLTIAKNQSYQPYLRPKGSFYAFRLKEGIEFHLFITTSPCGDARIFSLHENTGTGSGTGEGGKGPEGGDKEGEAGGCGETGEGGTVKDADELDSKDTLLVNEGLETTEFKSK